MPPAGYGMPRALSKWPIITHHCPFNNLRHSPDPRASHPCASCRCARLSRGIPSTGHDCTQQLSLFKIQKGAPLGGSPVQLQSVLMTSLMTSLIDVTDDVIRTSYGPCDVIITSSKCRQSSHFDDVLMVSLRLNDVNIDVIKRRFQPIQPRTRQSWPQLAHLSRFFWPGLPSVVCCKILSTHGHNLLSV